VRFPLRRFLPLADRLGVQLQDQLVRGRPQLAERHAGGGLGEEGVGLGRVFVGQDAGFVLDDPEMDRVDLPGAQGGEGGWQPGHDRGGVLHLLGGGLRGQVQLSSTGANSSAGRDPACRTAYSAIAAIEIHSSRACSRRPRR
jgi:hypothetical protein